jgi:hypothetical protein
MATGNLSAELRLSIVNSMRKRTTELAEKKVNCLMEGCDEKQNTFRVIAKHFKNKHSSKEVVGIRCDIPSCEWSCNRNLKCFTEHRKIHNVIADMDTKMTLVIVRKTRYTDHTAICNTMKAKTIAANKLKKDQERIARKEAKKANKDVTEEIPTDNHAQNPENINDVEISEEPLIFDEILDEGSEAESIPTLNAENVITQQQENILTTSTTELDISGYYDPDDTKNYEEDEIVEQVEDSEENTGDNSLGNPENEIRRGAVKSEFEEVDLTNSDGEEEIIEIIPVKKVKTTKRKLPVEKVKTQKRKLSFTVSDNIVKNKKMKLSFKVSDNIVKKSKGF